MRPTRSPVYAHVVGSLPNLSSGASTVSDQPKTEDDDRRALRITSLELPQYVWEQVETYKETHEHLRFRQIVMAGFRELGMQIDDEDLEAKVRARPMTRKPRRKVA